MIVKNKIPVVCTDMWVPMSKKECLRTLVNKSIQTAIYEPVAYEMVGYSPAIDYLIDDQNGPHAVIIDLMLFSLLLRIQRYFLIAVYIFDWSNWFLWFQLS